MTTALLHLLVRRKWNACIVCTQVQFKARMALTRIRCNASAINTSVGVFDIRITNRLANVRLAFVVAQPIARIAITQIWINANSMNTFNGAVWLANGVVAAAHFKSIYTDACLIHANAIDAVTAWYIGAVASCWIIDACLICCCTNTIHVLFKSFVT